MGLHGKNANELTFKASRAPTINLNNKKPELKNWALNFHISMRNREPVGKYNKILWGDTNWDKTNSLLKLGRKYLSIIIGILTVHWNLQLHRNRICFAVAASAGIGNDTIPDLNHHHHSCESLLDYSHNTGL